MLKLQESSARERPETEQSRHLNVRSATPTNDSSWPIFAKVIGLNRYNDPDELPFDSIDARHADLLFLERRRHPESTRK
jgi:hypothetical protein